MDWFALSLDAQERRLLRAFVESAQHEGVGSRALSHAANATFGDRDRWKAFFPKGPTQALWRISELSDASMRVPHLERPAAGMADVIETRFEQNRDLKPFVRRVMHYDCLHPVQALNRMQRTANVMFQCRASQSVVGVAKLATLNVSYTALVFFWLFDRSPNDTRTRSVTLMVMRMLRL